MGFAVGGRHDDLIPQEVGIAQFQILILADEGFLFAGGDVIQVKAAGLAQDIVVAGGNVEEFAIFGFEEAHCLILRSERGQLPAGLVKKVEAVAVFVDKSCAVAPVGELI